MLLLDEPLGALDLKLRRQMQDELKALQKRVGTAFIHVTHDQEEAMALADHCVVMNHGRIEDQGPPERVYSRPAIALHRHLHGREHIADRQGAGSRHGRDPRRHRSRPGRHLGARANRASTSRWRSGRSTSRWSMCRPRWRSATPRSTDVVFQGSFKRLLAVSAKNPEVTFIVKVPSNRPVSVGDTVELFCPAADMILMSR